ncbi:peptidase P60 [Devosia sp. YIM 151766]|uniref:peptidase P60 n=1 Tax=Devosia sp. YIM 151766 TaxID=3017325 RepID=UPI00255CC688|nr:peptidase P60 [Devosia sp. YIM 151766]WIY52465.1 peptidase P60 [Devosia sp. YIM 151766]
MKAPRGAAAARVIAAARSWIGTPYHDQASVKDVGCDCLGLARGVWREVVGPEPTRIPPYTRDWGETGAVEVLATGALAWMVPLPLELLRPGAMLLFRMRDGAIAKHCGILTTDDTFVHAYDRIGVVEEPMTESWRRRIAFAFVYPIRPRAKTKR